MASLFYFIRIAILEPAIFIPSGFAAPAPKLPFYWLYLIASAIFAAPLK
jgi:hypothetical protein